MADNDALLKEARDAFAEADAAESENRTNYRDDVRFAREGVQWPDHVVRQREVERRPILTINKMESFIRQVVNDARQNKPSIKVHPADSNADPETAKVIDGLIRNIEYASDADVAYDTATECAVSGGFGYFRIALDYAYEDSFDLDICIKRVANPLSVYGDPQSTAADSSDWNTAFITEQLTTDEFDVKYKGKAKVDWDDTSWSDAGIAWRSQNLVTVAEWWKREEYEKPILQVVDVRDGSVLTLDKKEFASNEDAQMLAQTGILQVKAERITKCHRVAQHIMSGAEILETNPWPGKFIPIVPVYGLEFYIDGRRVLRSLIHNAKDAQRMFNYWRSTSTELVALAPRVPFIGPKGAFDSDQERWNTANTQSHSYLEYDVVAAAGGTPPQRQPLDVGPAAGALQEALTASDDMKAIIGLYDASLGARSNETSGVAIRARQGEGDVSTFHFMDNMTRAIRHAGRIMIDLIPKVYTGQRIIRVLGEDTKPQNVPLGQPTPQVDPKTGQPMVDPMGQAIMRMHDLTAGKYDLTVKSGPSFTTRREEAAMQMTELVRAFPQAAPIIAPELAKNLDWPSADTIAEKMEQQASGQLPPEVQQQMQAGQQQIQQLSQENQQLKLGEAGDIAKVQSNERIQQMKIDSDERIAKMKMISEQQIAAYKAKVSAEASVAAAAARPHPVPAGTA